MYLNCERWVSLALQAAFEKNLHDLDATSIQNLFPKSEKIHFGTFIHIGMKELNELPVLARITRTDLGFHGLVPKERFETKKQIAIVTNSSDNTFKEDTKIAYKVKHIISLK